MNVQTQLLPQLQTSLTLGHDWLKQMATAAAEYNLTIQYCMSNPRHALQSIEFPAVTQVSIHKLGLNRWLQQPQNTISLYSIVCPIPDMPYKVLNSQLSLR